MKTFSALLMVLAGWIVSRPAHACQAWGQVAGCWAVDPCGLQPPQNTGPVLTRCGTFTGFDDNGMQRSIVCPASCPNGETCGFFGDDPNSGQHPNICAPTCQQQGAICGLVPIANNDGSDSGDRVDCGVCGSGLTCTTAHQCCQPATACPSGVSCGSAADGCGGTLNCGACASGTVCSSGACCTPATCASLHARCGVLSDGCGGVTANCGSCPGPGDTCSAKGVCDCTNPTTCASAGYACGLLNTGCGGQVSCGTCNGTSVCNEQTHQCCTPTTCAARNASCGQIGDDCDGTLNCGTCPSGSYCGSNLACVAGDPPPPAPAVPWPGRIALAAGLALVGLTLARKR